jgi:predicted NUDIX family phosphoesterase
MSEIVLAVHTAELRKILGSRPFIALPQEEIDRLHASIEVFTIDHNQTEKDSSITQLVAFTAIHYNYSWLTCSYPGFNHKRGLAKACSVGFTGHIRPDDGNGLFLDDSLKAAASRILADNFGIMVGYTVRLAGLLFDDSTGFGRIHLGLVYVVKLRQAGIDGDNRKGDFEISFCGMGELQQNCDRFENWSRILIGNLNAL